MICKHLCKRVTFISLLLNTKFYSNVILIYFSYTFFVVINLCVQGKVLNILSREHGYCSYSLCTLGIQPASIITFPSNTCISYM